MLERACSLAAAGVWIEGAVSLNTVRRNERLNRDQGNHFRFVGQSGMAGFGSRLADSCRSLSIPVTTFVSHLLKHHEHRVDQCGKWNVSSV